jgi:hypothetical protein
MKPRTGIHDLKHIPNVGPATIRYLNKLGIKKPIELTGQNPYLMFRKLCRTTGKDFNPCLTDVFISAVKFMEGAPPHKWWHYTEERKKHSDFKKTQEVQFKPLAAYSKVRKTLRRNDPL